MNSISLNSVLQDYQAAIHLNVEEAIEKSQHCKSVRYAGFLVGLDYECVIPFRLSSDRFDDCAADEMGFVGSPEVDVAADAIFEFPDESVSEEVKLFAMRDACLNCAQSWISHVREESPGATGLLTGERWMEYGWILSGRHLNDSDPLVFFQDDFRIDLAKLNALSKLESERDDHFWESA